MSLIEKMGEAFIEGFVSELAKLPAEAVKLVVELVQGANESEDPKRYIERRLIADGAHLAAQGTVDAALAAASDDDDPPTTVLGTGKGG